MDSAHLQLLGAFDLRSGDHPVNVACGLQRLLAFLAVRGPTHRCYLAGTLWPEVSDHQALASLRTAMWRLNRLLPGIVTAQGVGVSTMHGLIVDSREQEDLATNILRGCVRDDQWVREGLPILLHGELLPGWYDDWVVSERERLSQLRVHALERSAQMLIRSRRLDIALLAALEAVRAEPLRESANATLMSVHLAEGNVWNAVHHYEYYQGRLRQELGVTPSAAFSQLLLKCGVTRVRAYDVAPTGSLLP